MKKNNSFNSSIDVYLRKIERFFPYSKSIRKNAVDNLRIDIEAAMQDTTLSDPVIVFGNPMDVAKNYALNYEWGVKQANPLVQFLAYFIDLLVSLNLGIFFLGILGIYWWRLMAYWKRTSPGSLELFNMGALAVEIYLIFLVIISWLLTFGHGMILERYFSTTIGKRIFGLVVCDHTGIRITWEQAIVRNVSKLLPGLILFDLLLGKLFQAGSSLRISDKFVSTVVKEESKISYQKIGLAIVVMIILFFCPYLLLELMSPLVMESTHY